MTTPAANERSPSSPTSPESETVLKKRKMATKVTPEGLVVDAAVLDAVARRVVGFLERGDRVVARRLLTRVNRQLERIGVPAAVFSTTKADGAATRMETWLAEWQPGDTHIFVANVVVEDGLCPGSTMLLDGGDGNVKFAFRHAAAYLMHTQRSRMLGALGSGTGELSICRLLASLATWVVASLQHDMATGSIGAFFIKLQTGGEVLKGQTGRDGRGAGIIFDETGRSQVVSKFVDCVAQSGA